MKKFSYLMVLGAALCTTPVGATSNIKEATTACEKEVPAQCVAVSCPAFCARDGKKIPDCVKKCTLTEFCKLKPPGKTSGPTAKLDAQSNDQLMQCIAQKRDPDGKGSTGRRMEDWKTLGTYK